MVVFGGLVAFVHTPAANAEAPGLQLTPLQYVGDLTPGKTKSGYVDVANPSASTVAIQSRVQAFRQIGNQGKLEFYDDARYSEAIKVDLVSFELGPREAVRVPFTVSPSKLPGGGVYAVIFFRTVPPAQSAASSYVAESANLGTLLELTNGPAGPHRGRVAVASFKFFQFGRGLTGTLTYENTDTTERPVGFRPALDVRLAPWAKPHRLTAGLVLPGATRDFAVSKPGSYFGILPMSITDTDTGVKTTRWILICTGWCQWAVLVGLVAILLVVAFGRRLPRAFMRPGKALPSAWRAIRRKIRAKPVPKPAPRRSLDGVVLRSGPATSLDADEAKVDLSDRRPEPVHSSDVTDAELPSTNLVEPSVALASADAPAEVTAAAEAVPVDFVDPILQAGQSGADPRTPAFEPLPESPLPAKKRRSKSVKTTKPARSSRNEKTGKVSRPTNHRKQT